MQMPCYTIRLTTVNFEVANLDILKKALEQDFNAKCEIGDGGHALLATIPKMGVVSFHNGQVSLNSSQAQWIDQFKQSYAKEALRVVGTRYNWKLTQTANNKFEAVRRY
jgi:hypothetical protein